MAGLPDLVINLRANTVMLQKGLRTAGVAVTKLGVQTIKAAAGFVSISVAAAKATVAVVAFGRVAKAVAAQIAILAKGLLLMSGYMLLIGAVMGVKRLISFDDAIRATGATSRATAEEMLRLRDAALELGRTTSFTATEVANLMTTLGRAGFSPVEIEGMTDAVLNLARATGTDAEISSGVMAASLRQFSLGAGEATRVADVFTATANRTFNTVEQLGESMKFAGPVAHSLGMSLEETASVLGVLGNVGIQGSLAGTAIRRLGAITAAESKKMKRLFNFDFVDAAGDSTPMIDMLEGIGRATENLPTAERMSKMKEAFGLLGLGSATALSGAAGDAKQLAIDLQNVGGEAAATAAKMDAGIGGGFRRMMSAIDGMLISLGERLEPAFNSLAEVVKDAATFMTTGFDDVLHQIALVWTKVEVLTMNWGTAFSGLFKDITAFASAAFGWIHENASALIDNIIAMAAAAPSALENIGKNLGEKIAFEMGLSDEMMQFDPLEKFRSTPLTEFKMPELSSETLELYKKQNEAVKLLNEQRAATLALSGQETTAAEAAAKAAETAAAVGGGAELASGGSTFAGQGLQRGSAQAMETIMQNMGAGSSALDEAKKQTELLAEIAAQKHEKQKEGFTKLADVIRTGKSGSRSKDLVEKELKQANVYAKQMLNNMTFGAIGLIQEAVQ